MASNAIIFKCINTFGTYKTLLTSRICNQLYQQTAALRIETKKKLESLKIPEQPKRPLTPYFRYLALFRDVVRQKHPDWKIFEITKQCSQDWKTAEPNLKERLQNEYSKELEVYSKKQNEYTASLTQEQIEAIKSARKEKKEMKIKRAKKQRYRETSKPKRPLGSFLWYIKDKWQLVENKNKKLPELLQAYKGEWRMMSDLQKEKYVKLNESDRIRYEAEMLKWEAKMVEEGHSDIIRKDSQIITKTEDDSPKRVVKKSAKPKIKQSETIKKNKSD